MSLVGALDEPPYAGGMAVSVHDVAAALRARAPGLPVKKLHKLLYYSQGHHLATFGEPLFKETVSAWDMGPVVGELWYAEKNGAGVPGGARLDEAQLNTIGYVLSRYGALTGKDLENLTHGEAPWRRANMARRPQSSARIEQNWMREYFSQDGAPEADEVPLDSRAVTDWLAEARARRLEPAAADTPEAIRARLGAHG